jgi:SAM-dependent methyltransferase
MSTPAWLPDDIRLDRPNAARMYDYFLGGHHNFEIDRAAADQAAALRPDMPLVMRVNRAFLRRAVDYISAQGVDQFIDIGSGIPTVGNVHEAARRSNPNARVVYVDHEPVAVAHSTAILRDVPGTAIVQADARQPEQLLAHSEVSHLIDPTRPVGLLIVSVLHFIADDEEARRIVATLRDALPSGSFLAISHGSFEGLPPDIYDQVTRLYERTPTPFTGRSRAEIERFFEGFDLVEPGVVYLPLWHPEGPDDLMLDRPEQCNGFCGVGRKP